MQKEGLAALVVCQSIRQFSAVRPHPSEHDRPLSHATRSRDGRQEGRESGYYNLHRYLNNAIRLHTHQILRSDQFLSRSSPPSPPPPLLPPPVLPPVFPPVLPPLEPLPPVLPPDPLEGLPPSASSSFFRRLSTLINSACFRNWRLLMFCSCSCSGRKRMCRPSMFELMLNLSFVSAPPFLHSSVV